MRSVLSFHIKLLSSTKVMFKESGCAGVFLLEIFAVEYASRNYEHRSRMADKVICVICTTGNCGCFSESGVGVLTQ